MRTHEALWLPCTTFLIQARWNSCEATLSKQTRLLIKEASRQMLIRQTIKVIEHSARPSTRKAKTWAMGLQVLATSLKKWWNWGDAAIKKVAYSREKSTSTWPTRLPYSPHDRRSKGHQIRNCTGRLWIPQPHPSTRVRKCSSPPIRSTRVSASYTSGTAVQLKRRNPKAQQSVTCPSKISRPQM